MQTNFIEVIKPSMSLSRRELRLSAAVMQYGRVCVCVCRCLSRVVMSVCGHHKEPRVNDVDMAGSLRADVCVCVRVHSPSLASLG